MTPAKTEIERRLVKVEDGFEECLTMIRDNKEIATANKVTVDNLVTWQKNQNGLLTKLDDASGVTNGKLDNVTIVLATIQTASEMKDAFTNRIGWYIGLLGIVFGIVMTIIDKVGGK